MLKRTAFRPAVTDATRQALAQERQARRAAQIASLIAMKDLPDRPRSVIRLVGDVCAAVPKEVPERSESYRRWIATLPCMVCGVIGFSQAAHPNQGRGLGQKSSDHDCFPLCCDRPGQVGHHSAHDLLIGMTLDQRRVLELDYIRRTRAYALAVGRPEIA